VSEPLVNPEYPEELPYRRILDHGFVALVDAMGDDSSIVQAARVSYGKGTKTMRGDKALISYLMRHAHSTPLEMVEFKFLMRIPLFIARQVIRHRTANVNEYSARYSEVPDRFFVPELGALSTQDHVNRQGRTDLLRELVERLPDQKLQDGDAFLTVEEALDPARRAAFLGDADLLPSESYVALANRLLERFPNEKARRETVRDAFAKQNEESYALYKRLMDEGVAREIARCVLPLTMYTEWYWKIDLHNLFHFLRLRMDAHAQLEVRALAEAMATFVKPRVPFAWEAFAESRLDGTFLTGPEKAVLKPVDEDTQRAVLAGLYERGYRRRRLKEVCRKLDMDERLVDDVLP